LSVSTELLTIERSTTVELRRDLDSLRNQMKSEKAERAKVETELKLKNKSVSDNLKDSEKKLLSALQSIAALAKSKINLEFDISALKIQLEKLKKDVALTKRRRVRSPRRSRPTTQTNP
jgi:chromosome segregation ATPase